MLKQSFLCLFFCLSLFNAYAQNAKPKLVVGIVIDQMRYDYLYKYEKLFGEKGFKKLLKEGFSLQNTHFNYFPTVTAAGHASIYTGATPLYHGIVGNDWYDIESGKAVYCVEDKSVKTLGSNTDRGLFSPKNLFCPTITDALKIASPESKVFGVSIKDRGAILPAGHAANWAFWYDHTSGNFVSSSYYGKVLPEWLVKFNTKNRPEKLLSKGWDLALPKSKYNHFIFDNNEYEIPIGKNTKPAFPYSFDLQDSTINKWLPYTPFGNEVLTDLAIETIVHEKMGADNETDFLCLSYSSPDYIGHNFGTHSLELADCYARLDAELAELFTHIETQIGWENCTIFLTADHAVADNPIFLNEHFKLNSGAISSKLLRKQIDSLLSLQFGKANWVGFSTGEQIYFDREVLKQKNMSVEVVAKEAKKLLEKRNGIENIFTNEDINANAASDKFAKMAKMSANPFRKADLMIVLRPNWLVGGLLGTTHGSPYAYDTHAPLIFMGKNIPKGKSVKRVEIIDIAPTIALFLNLQFPACTIGEPIEAIFGE